MGTKAAKVLELARRGPVTARDLAAAGLKRDWLNRLHARGELTRVSRGVYRAVDNDATELGTLVEVAKRSPSLVFCLLTALQIHALTSEAPHEVWVLIENRARAPKITGTRLHVVRASGQAATHGIESRRVENTTIRVTSPPKTIADCFRYRDHVGLDVAVEALRNYLARSRATSDAEHVSDSRRIEPSHRTAFDDGRRAHTVDALLRAAKADGVTSVLRPYLEALT